MLAIYLETMGRIAWREKKTLNYGKQGYLYMTSATISTVGTGLFVLVVGR